MQVRLKTGDLACPACQQDHRIAHHGQCPDNRRWSFSDPARQPGLQAGAQVAHGVSEFGRILLRRIVACVDTAVVDQVGEVSGMLFA